MLMSVVGFMMFIGFFFDLEVEKIVKRERIELEVFIDLWYGV